MAMNLEKRAEELEKKGEELDMKSEKLERKAEELEKKKEEGEIKGNELESERGELKMRREELRKEREHLKKEREKLKNDRKQRQSVKLYIYNLVPSSSGGLPAIWHTGVVVYGKEFTYNNENGVCYQEEPGTPNEIRDYGQTKISEEELFKFLTSMNEYVPEKYDLRSRNCVTFCSEVLIYLTNLDVPQHIKEQAKKVERGVLKTLLGSSIATGAIIIRILTKR